MRPEVLRFRHHTRLDGFPWPWTHFLPAEMADMETGELVVVPSFMDWLEELRAIFGEPMIINDATRTPERQARHDGRRTGAHVDGMAVDVKVSGPTARRLLDVAVRRGVLGLGVYQGAGIPREKRFLHLDMWSKAPAGVRPGLW